MAIDRENSGGVFHNHLPALVEAEHARDVSVLLGTVPDFWLVDLMGKIIPYHAGKLDANTDIHLVVFQRNTVLRTPFGKKAAAHTADGKNDMLRRDAVLYAFAFIMHSMSGFVHIGHVGIRQNGYMFLQKSRHFSHGLEIGVRSQMLELGLRHMQVILQAFFLQLVVGHEALCRRAEVLQNTVCLLDVIQNLFGRQKIRQPAAVFCGNDVFAVGKSTCSGKALHNGAGGAFDTGRGFSGDDGACPLFDVVSFLEQNDLCPRRFCGKLVSAHQSADAASDDRNVIMLHDYLTPLLFAFAFIFILALYSAIARSYTLSTARMNSFSP